MTAAATLGLAFAACGGDGPTTPTTPPPDVAGTYYMTWQLQVLRKSDGFQTEFFCGGRITLSQAEPAGDTAALSGFVVVEAPCAPRPGQSLKRGASPAPLLQVSEVCTRRVVTPRGTEAGETVVAALLEKPTSPGTAGELSMVRAEETKVIVSSPGPKSRAWRKRRRAGSRWSRARWAMPR